MNNTSACMLLYGHSNYYKVGRRALLSILENTNFDVFVTLEKRQLRRLRLPDTPRLHYFFLPEKVINKARATPFLLKFRAIQNCIQNTRAPHVVLFDSDTVVVRKISGDDIVNALGGYALGMVEQTTIMGSGMNRTDFLRHYENHSLTWLGPDQIPPSLERFRFYNSGVVLGRRQEFSRLLEWALTTIARSPAEHHVGEHMIADQDYFQFWTNTMHPGSCRTLSWAWNHCQHWDDRFPRCESIVLHFSNFCRGFSYRQRLQMIYFQRKLRFKRLFDKSQSYLT